MAEVGWDDVTYLRKKTPKSAEARSNKVAIIESSHRDLTKYLFNGGYRPGKCLSV